MKSYVMLTVLLFVVSQVLSERDRYKLLTHQKECLTESRVETSLVHKVRLGDYKTSNKALMLYALCMMRKAGLLSDGGAFRKDVALSRVLYHSDLPAVHNVIESCLDKAGPTPEESAWNYVKCYHEKYPLDHIL